MAKRRGTRGSAAKGKARRGGQARRPRAGTARRVRYAVVGLGHIAQVAVLPAFAHAKARSQLVALFSGDQVKRDALAKKYRVPAFGYEQLEDAIVSEKVDAVYIALPNDQHLEFVERCARAKVHVLCEKPLGLSVEECQRMIRACDDAGVKLMSAYRLHFEPANLGAVEWVTSGKLGAPKFFSSDFSFQVKEGNIRAQSERGGGPVWDIGVYCINAARYLFRDEPMEVFAFAAAGSEPRFEEIDEGLSVLLRFPDEKLATFTCHFGAAPTGSYRLVGTRGTLELENAYEYVGPRTLRVTVDEKTREKRFPKMDQFAPELEAFSAAVLEGRELEPSGWEGLADVRIIEAINESVLTGEVVKLAPFDRAQRPDRSQEQRKPPVSKPTLVHAEAGHQ